MAATTVNDLGTVGAAIVRTGARMFALALVRHAWPEAARRVDARIVAETTRKGTNKR